MAEARLRMLVPLDGSPEAESILPALMPLFRSQKVRLTLLGVAPREDAASTVELYLGRLQTSLLVDAIPSEIKVAWGDPVDEIARAAQEAPIDLIAMASHGRMGLHRELVGSLTEAVLRQSAIPILAYRPGMKIGDWKRMVVALDGSAAAEAILSDVTELARALGATVHLIRVKGPKPRLTMHPGDAFPVPEEEPQPYLDAFADVLAAKGVLALAQARQGDAAEEILAFAREIGAGLICLGTHGRTGLSRSLLGSVAEIVLGTAPCPVLLRRRGTESASFAAPASGLRGEGPPAWKR
jgi:nucleotide-binding universal stress UspA family protein